MSRLRNLPSKLGRTWALHLLARQIELRYQVRTGTTHSFCGNETRVLGTRLPASLASLAALAEAGFRRRLAGAAEAPAAQ